MVEGCTALKPSLVGQGEDAESGLLLLKGIATTFGIHSWYSPLVMASASLMSEADGEEAPRSPLDPPSASPLLITFGESSRDN